MREEKEEKNREEGDDGCVDRNGEKRYDRSKWPSLNELVILTKTRLLNFVKRYPHRVESAPYSRKLEY